MFTSDGGASWTTSSVPTSGTILSISCATNLACVALGHSGPFQGTAAGGFVLRSNDGGRSWKTGALPQNFGFIQPLTGLSCADATHCMAIGVTSIPNPRQCRGTPPNVVPPPGYDSCDTSPTELVSAIAVSSDAGSTWRTTSLPSDLPIPQLYSISCASASVCWTAGQESVPQVIGNVHDEGSPVLLGTSDGGTTWTKETFTIPASAPNYLGQAYLAIGQISCPSSLTCVALGIAAQSAPSTPIYRYGNTGAQSG
jgi:photosystem II stability/assembly factor-like uncharacterized protein